MEDNNLDYEQEITSAEDMESVEMPTDSVDTAELDIEAEVEAENAAKDDAYIQELEDIAKAQKNLDIDVDENDHKSDVDNIENEEYDKVNLDDAFYASTEEMFDNIDKAYLNSKTAYWEKEKDKFIQEFGEEKAEEEFDKYYDKKDTEYQAMIQKQQDKILLAHGMTNMLYDDGSAYEDALSSVHATRETLTGARQTGDITTRDRISRRQGMVGLGRFLDDQGNVVKLDKDENFLTWWDSDDEKDITFSDKYTSKDGRQIVGFEYGDKGYLEALYEGDIPKHEMLSVWDATDVLASNALDSKWTELPKCVVRSGVNLVADAMIGMVELGNSMNVLMGDKEDVDYTRDQSSVLRRYKLSKSDYDNEHLFTLSNGMDFVVNTYLQLVLAAGVGKIAASGAAMLASEVGATSSLVKAAEAAKAAGNIKKYMLLRKRAQNLVAIPSKAASLGVMSLMAGAGIKDEARAAGFSEKAIAGMYLAYLPAMMAASSTSGFLENVDNMRANKEIINKALKSSLAFTDEAAVTTSKGAIAWANKASKKVIGAIRKHTGKNGVWDKGLQGYLHAGLNEGREEVIEQIYEEGLKHASTAVSLLTAEDSDKAPRFKTVTDKGYISEKLQEAVMNFVGGFMGGTFAKASFGHVPEGELPFKGDDKDALLKIAAGPEADQDLFLDTLHKSYKNGLLGSHDLLLEIDPETGKHKKVTDLPESQRKDAVTLAKANRRAILYQFNKYKSYVGGARENVDKLEKEFPELYAQLESSETLPALLAEAYEDIASFYDGLGESDPSTVKLAVDDILDKSSLTSALKNKKKKDTVTVKAEKDAEDGVDSEVAGAEDGVTEPLEDVDQEIDVVVSEDAIELAERANITLTQAQDILSKEQKMRDIMSGKYIESMFLAEKLSSDPQFSILHGKDAKKLYATFGDKFLDAINQSDVKALLEANIATKAKTKAMQSNAELVKTLLTDEASFEALKAQIANNDEVFISTQDLETLRESLSTAYAQKMADPKLSEDTLAHFNETFKDAKVLSEDDAYENLDRKFTATDKDGKTISIEIDALVDDKDIIAYANAVGVTIGEGKDFASAKKFATYLLMTKNEAMIKNHINGLALQSITNASADGALSPDILNNAKTIDDYESFIGSVLNFVDDTDRAIDLYEDAIYSKYIPILQASTAKGNTGVTTLGLIDSPVKSMMDEHTNTIETLETKAVTNIPPVYENDTTAFFGNAFSVGNDAITTSQKPIAEAVNDLMHTNMFSLSNTAFNVHEAALDPTSEDIVFKGVDEAQSLLDQTNTRIAQINFLMSSMDQLAELRKRNLNIYSDKDVRSLFDPKAYDNYSKYVSSYIIDPVKWNELVKKAEFNSLTEEEKELQKRMQRRIESLYNPDSEQGSIMDQLQASKMYLESLIKLGDSSQTAAKLTKAFKTAVGTSAKEINEQFEILLEKEESLENVPEIVSAIKYFSTFDENEASDEELVNANAVIKNAANALYAWKMQNKEKGQALENLLASSHFRIGKINGDYASSMTDVACFLAVPYDQFLTDYKTNITALLKTNPNINIPTIVQQRVAHHVYAMGMAGLSSGSVDIPAGDSVMWVEGLYGTGKTTVAAGYGIGTLQSTYEVEHPGHSDALFCSNNEAQTSKLAEIVDSEFNIKAKKGPTNGGFTKEDLIQLLESDDAYDKMESASFIVYDEATQIEFDPENEESDLMRILSAIENLNTERKKKNVPTIKLILMGDTAQGGYLEGMSTSLDPTAEVSYPKSGKAVNISTQVNGLFSSPKLTYSFRSSISQIKAVTDIFSNIADRVRTTRPFGTEMPINAGYGRIANDPNGAMGGVQTVSASTELYTNELVDDLKTQLEKDPNFTAVIVDNTLRGDMNNITNPALVELIKENPDRIKIHTTSSVQGAEHDYVIANFGETFIHNIKDTTVSNKYALNIASMVLGRATKYVKAYFGNRLDIQSSEQKVMMLTKDNDTSIKEEWKSFVMDGMLTNTEVNENMLAKQTQEKTEPTSKKEIPDSLQFKEGEEVFRQSVPGARPLKYTVKSMNGSIVEFVDVQGNVVAFNYDTDIDSIEQFKRSKNGGRDLMTDIPTEIIDWAYTNKVVEGVQMKDANGVSYEVTKAGDTEIVLENALTKEAITIGYSDLQTSFVVEEFENPSEELIAEYENDSEKRIISPEMRHYKKALEAIIPGKHYKSADGTVYKVVSKFVKDGGYTLDSLKVTDPDGNDVILKSIEGLVPVSGTHKKKKTKEVDTSSNTVGIDNSPTVKVEKLDKKSIPATMDTISFEVNGKSMLLSDLEKAIKNVNKKIEDAAKTNRPIPLEYINEKADLMKALSVFEGTASLDSTEDTNGQLIGEILNSIDTSFDAQIDSEKVDAKEYMAALEEQGIGVFYTNRESETNTKAIDAVFDSSRRRYYAGAEMYGFSTKRMEDVPDFVTKLVKKALPMYETDRQQQMQQMSEFEYYLNTYEYYHKGDMVIGHGLFARHKATKTPMLLGLIPTNSLADESKIKSILADRRDTLQNAVAAYTRDGSIAAGVKEGRTLSIWKDTKGKLKESRSSAGKTNLFIETPIKSLNAVLDLIKQPTIGGFVTNSPKSLQQFTEVAKAAGQDMTLNMYTTRRMQSAESLRNSVKESKGKVTAAVLKDSGVFGQFTKGKHITAMKTPHGTFPVISVKLENESYGLFYKHPKHGFMPFFGLERVDDTNLDGIPIEDADSIEAYLNSKDVLYNEEFTAIKEELDKSFKTLSYKNNTVKGYKGVTHTFKTDELTQIFANAVGYDSKVVNNRSLKGDKLFEAVSAKQLNKSQKSWANASVPLSLFDLMMGRFGRKDAGLQLSPLMVFRSTDSKYRGRLFKIYTYNPSIDVNSEEGMAKIKAILGDSLKKGTLNESLLSRHGIGILGINADPSSFADVYKYYESGIAHDTMNKLVVPAKSEASMRLANMFVELLNFYDTSTSGDQYSRVQEYKHLLSTDGKMSNVLRQDKRSQDNLRKLLTYASKDPVMNEARVLLKKLVIKMSDNSALGSLLVRPDSSTTTVEFNAQDKVSGEILLNKDTAQPIIFNKSPLTIFPKEKYNEAIGAGLIKSQDVQKNDVVRFDLHELMATIDRMESDPKIKAKMMEIVDEVMTHYTKPGTLNRGLNISPSIAGNIGIGEIWSKVDTSTVDKNGRNAISRCSVRVKDIKQPNVLFNIDALAKVVDGGKEATREYKSATDIAPQIEKVIDDLKRNMDAIWKDDQSDKVNRYRKAHKNALTVYEAIAKSLHPKDGVVKQMYEDAINNELAAMLSKRGFAKKFSQDETIEAVFNNLEALTSQSMQSTPTLRSSILASKYLSGLDLGDVTTPVNNIQSIQGRVISSLFAADKESMIAELENMSQEVSDNLPVEGIKFFNNIVDLLKTSDFEMTQQMFRYLVTEASVRNIDLQIFRSYTPDDVLGNYIDISDFAAFRRTVASILTDPAVNQVIKDQVNREMFETGGVYDFMETRDKFLSFLLNNHNESIESSPEYHKLSEMGVDFEAIAKGTEEDHHIIQSAWDTRFEEGGLMLNGDSKDAQLKKLYDVLNDVSKDSTITKADKLDILAQLQKQVSASFFATNEKLNAMIDKVINDLNAEKESSTKDVILSKYAGKVSPETSQVLDSIAKDIDEFTTDEFTTNLTELLGGNMDDITQSDFILGDWMNFLKTVKASRGVEVAKHYSTTFIELSRDVDNTKGCNTKM